MVTRSMLVLMAFAGAATLGSGVSCNGSLAPLDGR
jgi:hypothetical protein